MRGVVLMHTIEKVKKGTKEVFMRFSGSASKIHQTVSERNRESTKGCALLS